jgi:hypothetical protein
MEISNRKLLFLQHVINMDESSLAREILDVQKSEHNFIIMVEPKLLTWPSTG